MNSIKTELIPYKTLPSGDQSSLIKYIIKGINDGPQVYIQSSLHGAELQGNAVIYLLLEYLKDNPINGKIEIIPQANPEGLNSKILKYTQGRYNLETGDNWNRLYFDFLEDSDLVDLNDIKGSFSKILDTYYHKSNKPYYLNYLLQKNAIKADIVLDLHTAPVGTRYLYVPEYAFEKGKDLKFPFNIIIPPGFAGALDEAIFTPWLKLSKDKNIDVPVEAYTLELGGEEIIDLKEANTDLNRILHLFSKRGVITSPIKFEEKQFYSKLENFKTYYSKKPGLYNFNFKVGDFFQKNDNLCDIINFKPSLSKTEFLAPSDGILINRYPSSNVSEHAELFQALESPSSY